MYNNMMDLDGPPGHLNEEGSGIDYLSEPCRAEVNGSRIIHQKRSNKPETGVDGEEITDLVDPEKKQEAKLLNEFISSK